MKKKVKSSFPKKLNAAVFPAQLAREEIFKSPVWIGNAPEFVEKLNKSADPYVEKTKIYTADYKS